MDDLLACYRRASEWTLGKVSGATSKLDAPTPCEGWNVRTLLNHMLAIQRYFLGVARGEEVSLPSPDPPASLSDDPVADFSHVRQEVIEAFSVPGVIERTGIALVAAFGDQLMHGWDLARATQQDATMPVGLAQVAYDAIYGQFGDEQRPGIFKPEIEVPDDATPQEKLLAYTGRAAS